MSGKKKQNTCKATVISDSDGRLLWQGAFRPGRMHDVTALRTEGIEQLLRLHPQVKAKVDSGLSTLIVDTGCYAADASLLVGLVSYSVGLRWPRAECRRRVL